VTFLIIYYIEKKEKKKRMSGCQLRSHHLEVTRPPATNGVVRGHPQRDPEMARGHPQVAERGLQAISREI
jgi:hypothetical protein